MLTLAASVTAAAATLGAIASTTAKRDDDEDAVKELMSGALTGRVAILVHLIEETRRVHVDARDINGATALATAAAAGQAEALFTLLSLGADHRAICARGSLAIHAAAGGGHVSTLQPLVDRGHFWACKKDADGNTPLHYAAQSCASEAVSILLAEMVPLDARNAKQQTPLMLAAKAATECGAAVTTIKLLLHSHADVNAVDYQGNSPLHLACMSSTNPGFSGDGSVADVVEILCNAGARLFGQNCDGNTALDLAQTESPEREKLARILASRQRKGEQEANAYTVARDRLMTRIRSMARRDPVALKALCEEPETRRLLARFNLTGFRISVDDSMGGDDSLRSSRNPSSRGFVSSVVTDESALLADDSERQSPGERSPPPTERVTRSLRAMVAALDPS